MRGPGGQRIAKSYGFCEIAEVRLTEKKLKCKNIYTW